MLARAAALAAELGVVLPISFYEREGNARFNSVAVFDADGAHLGTYRKTHIPDGPGYQEKVRRRGPLLFWAACLLAVAGQGNSVIFGPFLPLLCNARLATLRAPPPPAVFLLARRQAALGVPHALRAAWCRHLLGSGGGAGRQAHME